MTRFSRNARRAALAIAPVLLVFAAGSSAAGNAAPSVTVGAAPSLSTGATPLGTLAGTTPLHLTVVLASRDPAGLASLASAVSVPGSPQYRNYLTVGQFAARFGASPSEVGAVSATLRGSGLTPGALAADRLSLAVSGSAAEASHAFGVSLGRFRERDGRQIYANTAAPRLPASLGPAVAAVLGLDNVPAAAPAHVLRGGVTRTAHAAASASVVGSGGVTPCPAATGAASASHTYTINQVAGAYGMGGLYASGDFGAGVTVALYELEPYAPSDLAQFQSCFGTTATVNPIEVDGGPGTPSGPDAGLETVLDLDNVIGVSPSSKVEVYQGPNTGAGVYDTFQQIVNRNTAQVISDSWGLCESLTGASEAAAEDPLFQQAAVQGQSILAAAGDAGSQACLPANRSHALAVSDAASQPFATGVGGTTLATLGPPAGESVWNDGSSAGGGGISNLWPMPAYQRALGVSGSSSQTACQGSPLYVAGSYCREVPDVSADAAPSTGYEIYYQAAGGWLAAGGTSAATPLWAGLTALADASGVGGCTAASPLGFLNPKLYAIAAGAAHAAALSDVTVGNNSLPGGPVLYPAAAGYDMASGLGTPIATDGALPGLVAQLCGPTATITAPASGGTYTQTQSVPAGYSCASSVPGPLVCSGPVANGAAIDTSTVGPHTFTVTATDANGTRTQRTVSYTVIAPPTATIATPVNGAVYTSGQAVSAAYSCAASTAGAPSCAGTLPSGTPLDTAIPGVHSFAVTATDANGVAASQTASYTIVSPPRVTIAVPANGASYAKGRHARASFGCVASAPLAIAKCVSPIPDGAAIRTATLGPHSFTVTGVDSNGVATVRVVRYTVVAPRPTISGLRQSAAVWLEHRRVRNGRALGTTFAFSLDQKATLTFRFTRAGSGRVAAGRCVAPTGTHADARVCTRDLPAGTLTLAARPGANAVPFAGKTSTGPLAPGTYTVLVSAIGVGGEWSTSRSLRFVVAGPTGS